MSVNGTELAIGQRWKTRDGQEVAIVGSTAPCWPWDLSNGESVDNDGNVWSSDETDDSDLSTLLQDEHGFIPWNGGECPVGEDITVEVKFRNGEIPDNLYGQDWNWAKDGSPYDIIAYRVVQQDKQPEVQKEEVMEEPRYTIKEVFESINRVTTCEVHMDEIDLVEEDLAKTHDPDYKLYLELKSRFESNE